MKSKFIYIAFIISLIVLTSFVSINCVAQEKPRSEEQKTDSHADDHAKHTGETNKRGEREMGFSQTKTTHHFRLTPEGGTIQVEVKDAKDTATAEQINKHLSHIAQMFSAGNFKTPMLIHDRTPPGVSVMQQLKAEISYQFEDTGKGGRIRIKTTNTGAIKAIHEFLRFQITEHETGDSLEVSS